MPKPAPSTTEVPEERAPSYRETQLSQINDARREFLLEEGFDAKDLPPPESAADPEITPAADNAEPAAAAADAAAGEASPAADPAPAPERLIDVVVDGKPLQVTEKQLLEGFQIASTARSRLETATDILKSAKKIAAKTDGGEGAGAAADGSPAAAKPAPKELPPEPDYEALTKSIQFDDPADSAKKLKEFVEQTNLRAEAVAASKQTDAPPPLNVDAVARRVTDKLEWDNSLVNLATHHSDILVVPELAGMVAGIAKQQFEADLAKIREEGTGTRRPFQEYFDNGIARVREITGRAKPADANGQQDSPAAPNGTPKNGNGQQQHTQVDLDPSRVALKRALPSQPTPRRAASPGAAPAAQVEFTESADLARRQSAISEITASRRPTLRQR